jgi:hypothetical protein
MSQYLILKKCCANADASSQGIIWLSGAMMHNIASDFLRSFLSMIDRRSYNTVVDARITVVHRQQVK